MTPNQYQLKIYHNIFKIKDIWNKIYSQNPNLSVFQDFEYSKNIFKKNTFYKSRIPTFITITDTSKNEVILIAPFTKKIFTHKTKPTYYLFGDIQACDICDFIYSKDMTVEDMIDCFQLIRSHIKGIILIRRLNDRSLLVNALKILYPNNELICYPQVKIVTDGNYDNYIKSLSKSVRQNIRTAYNRLEKDNMTYSLDVAMPIYQNKTGLWIEALKSYVNRQINQFGNIKYKSNFLTYLFYKYFKHDTISLTNMKNGCLFCLRINGEIAGMLTGFVYNTDKSIVIPRLAINPKYKAYSPGSLLIAETMKYLLSHTDLISIDLSRGNEEYKYKMGGVLYCTYMIRIL